MVCLPNTLHYLGGRPLKEIEIYEKYKLFIDKRIIEKSKKTICQDLEINSKIFKQFLDKYLEEKLEYKSRTYELNKLQNFDKKLAVINEARILISQNYSITQISKVLKLDRRTITKYINPTFKYNNSIKRINNLDPYYSFIERNINKSIKMIYIYKIIKDKRYGGSYSTLRSYCRQFKFKYNSSCTSTNEDKIELKNVIKILYHPLKKLKK